MANSSIYAAFERMWQHITNRLSGYATQTYVDNKVASLVDSAPGTLDTLNELAAALGDDPNFAVTITNELAQVKEKVEKDEHFFAQDTEPTQAVDGDFWIDTSITPAAVQKFYSQTEEPSEAIEGDFWIDTDA